MMTTMLEAKRVNKLTIGPPKTKPEVCEVVNKLDNDKMPANH